MDGVLVAPQEFIALFFMAPQEEPYNLFTLLTYDRGLHHSFSKDFTRLVDRVCVILYKKLLSPEATLCLDNRERHFFLYGK